MDHTAVEMKENEQKEEKELTPEEIEDLLTRCCDNLGMS